MKVYVITEGEYSSYHIEYVTMDKKKAEDFVEFKNERCKWDSWEVNEFELDDMPTVEFSETVWECGQMISNGRLGVVDADESYLSLDDEHLNIVKFSFDTMFLTCYVKAKRKADAIKKASDLFASWYARFMSL